jgi:peptidoglycan/LPS O-acetylase OafA/YrhL
VVRKFAFASALIALWAPALPKTFKVSRVGEIFGKFLLPLGKEDYAAANQVGHFFAIDLARGLAAVTTIIWHYQHFYGIVRYGQTVNVEHLPLYRVLFPLYEHGFWGVNAFFVISGFVFAHVYAGRQTTAWNFASARFARLYPLHLVTLLTIGFAQIVSFALLGRYQLVGDNGPQHFALHLLFIGGWQLIPGVNFNGPVWSVSIEIAIYGVFFLMARYVLSAGILVPAFVALVSWLILIRQSPVSNFLMCAFFFYTGVSVYFYLLRFRNNLAAILLPSTACLFIFALLIYTGENKLMRFFNLQFFLFVPLVLLMGRLDFVDAIRTSVSKIRWIGDSTYSMYLWHFPVQVVVLIIVGYFGIGTAIFNRPTALAIWIVFMSAMSYISFLYFERPARDFTRRKLREIEVAPPRP